MVAKEMTEMKEVTENIQRITEMVTVNEMIKKAHEKYPKNQILLIEIHPEVKKYHLSARTESKS